MAAGSEDGPMLLSSGLSSGLSLDVAPGFGDQLSELYRVQTALVRRRRAREMLERDRRRRQYLRRRRAFLLSSIAAILSLITSTNRPVWVRNPSLGQNFWSAAESFDDDDDGYLFPRQKSAVSDGVAVPVHLIGEASFPLKPWLMKGYRLEEQLTPEQRCFTYALTSAHSVVDAAFTRLKGRWRCLQKKSVSMMPRVVAACCVLHNICEARRDHFLPEWTAEADPSAGSLRQPDTELYDGDAYCTAEVIRDTMTYNLLTILQV